MVEPASSLQAQQLLELLTIVTSLPDEASAVHSAAERAAQALEAEVAAVAIDGRVAAVVGFPAEAVPTSELLAVGCGQQDRLIVPGLGKCPTLAACNKLKALGSTLTREQAKVNEQLLTEMTRKRNFTDRIRNDLRYRTLLQLWLKGYYGA